MELVQNACDFVKIPVGGLSCLGKECSFFFNNNQVMLNTIAIYEGVSKSFRTESITK
jgi:hypothetical protein